MSVVEWTCEDARSKGFAVVRSPPILRPGDLCVVSDDQRLDLLYRDRNDVQSSVYHVEPGVAWIYGVMTVDRGRMLDPLTGETWRRFDDHDTAARNLWLVFSAAILDTLYTRTWVFEAAPTRLFQTRIINKIRAVYEGAL